MEPDPIDKAIADRAGGDEPVCLYGYDLDALTRHVEAVVAALPQRCRMFYAMKANSAGPVLRALAPVVAGFEVASGGEVAKARAAGDVPVIFGGPAKTETEIAEALKQGVTRLHAESVLELHRISAAAEAANEVAEVLLRVNLAVVPVAIQQAGAALPPTTASAPPGGPRMLDHNCLGGNRASETTGGQGDGNGASRQQGPFPSATLAMAGRPTQFGIDETELSGAVRLARQLPSVRLAGFHLHSLSNNLSPDAHLQMLALYRDKVLGWEEEFGLRCEVLNVGGGIGVNYADLEAQFDWPRFTEGLAGLVDTFPAHWSEIDFECGRFLVAACGKYAVEVLDVKRNHGVNYVLVRGGTHQFRLPSSWQHSHPFTVHPVDRWRSAAPRPEIRGEPVTVVGELCTPKDVLARDITVSQVRAGDVIVFSHAGAYGWEISHHDFLSHPHPEQVFHSAAAR